MSNANETTRTNEPQAAPQPYVIHEFMIAIVGTIRMTSSEMNDDLAERHYQKYARDILIFARALAQEFTNACPPVPCPPAPPVFLPPPDIYLHTSCTCGHTRAGHSTRNGTLPNTGPCMKCEKCAGFIPEVNVGGVPIPGVNRDVAFINLGGGGIRDGGPGL